MKQKGGAYVQVKRPVSRSMAGNEDDIVVICTQVYTPVFTVSLLAERESERESEQVNESESPHSRLCAGDQNHLCCFYF